MSKEEIYIALESCSDMAKEELKMLGLKDGLSQEELIQLFSFCSEPTFQELVNLNIFGPVVTLDQLIQLCSGVEEGGLPNSFATLQIDSVMEDLSTEPYANISFGNPVINIYASGGCVVVTADFSKHNMFEYRRARDILSEWTDKQGTKEFANKFLSLVVSPVLLNGEILLVFHELVFAQGTVVDDGVYRLIMAFDGNQMQDIMSSEIKLDEVKASVDAEFARREMEAKAAMAMAHQYQQAEETETNPYQEFTEDKYNKSYLSDDTNYDDVEDELEGPEENGTPGDDWMRIAKD